MEPTIAEMPDGRILMVLRGSNDAKPQLPGHKWFTTSADEGKTWEPVTRWTCTDGSPFFSPSSMSQLVRHSSGRYFWIGNITPENPCGNVDSVRAPRANWCPGAVTEPMIWTDEALEAPGPHEVQPTIDLLLPGGSWRVSLLYVALGT